MIASVLIEYNVKSLDKTFDYLIPNEMINIIRIGHKVLVPFGNTNIEGFVLNIKNECDSSLSYKSITKIVDIDFYLKKDLLTLGTIMSKSTLSNLISCYQVMLPKALKASNKTNISKKYNTYIEINHEINIDNYKKDNSRKKRQLEIIEFLGDKKVLKNSIKSTVISDMIKSGILIESKIEIKREVSFNNEDYKSIKLTHEQEYVCDTIINGDNEKPYLLHGVTGSGKTEVYINLIKYYIKINKSSILLVPEISLTPQIVSKFKSVFGDSVAVIHSRLSEGEKYDEYRRILEGKVNVVIGARSAVFAPLDNLGLIIIDECQSATYKQESNPKYNGIEVAINRCILNNAVCLMGSATPLLEQYARAKKGVFKLLELKTRISKKLPNITLVDMSLEVKKRNFIISELLDSKIKESLNNNEQILILLNRRGYSTFISCSNCGYVYKCPNCDISMTYHKSTNNLICHYCGYQHKMNNICPECKEESIKDLGLGTEKLESIIKEKYTNARVVRMDADTVVRKGSYEKIIGEFKNHEHDILIGTQMISKGLNFPNVSLVGVINADSSLYIPDFRSGERTFELLTQTSGRSGRYIIDGNVIIQTYNPDHYVFKHLVTNDYVSFYNYEMSIRRRLGYPPYYNIVLIKVSSEDYELSKIESKKIKKFLDKELNNSYYILGPSTARIFKLKGMFTFQMIIKYKQDNNLMSSLKKLNSSFINQNIKLDIDINPINIL